MAILQRKSLKREAGQDDGSFLADSVVLMEII